MPVPVSGGPGVTGDDRLGWQPLVQLVVDAPGVDAVGVVEHRLGCISFSQSTHVLGDPFLPRQVGLLLQKGESASSVCLTSPQMFSSVGYRSPICSGLRSTWIARAAALGQVLGVGVVGAKDEERVAVVHLMLARGGPEQSELLGVEGHVGRDDLLGPQGGDDAGAGQLGCLQHLGGGAVRVRGPPGR